MATPKPGEIRCPTCHRSTPPAAFCTQCGSAIPSDARIRPRGMDRDELQDRIRARRSGGEPYRRGGTVDDEQADYQRYEPDPTDARARRARPADDRRRDYLEEGTTAGDLTRDRDDWARPAAVPSQTSAVPPMADFAPPPSDVPLDDDNAYVDNFDDDAYPDGGYPYEYDEWQEPRERRSGAGAFAILGFLALGVLALLGGALLAGIFNPGPVGQGDGSPSPSASAASLAPSAAASVAPSTSAAASGSPDASGGPVVFPDGFTAEAEPCLPGSAGGTGCDSNGVSNAGVVDIWVGFQSGTANDVLGATLTGPGEDDPPVDASIDLARIGCTQSCNGWTYFPFRNLQPGTYQVEITRNGEPAGSTTFEVT